MYNKITTKNKTLKLNQLRQLIREEISKAMNEETDIISFLKSNKQELLSKLAKRFEWDEDDMEMMSEYEIEMGADANGEIDKEIAALGEAGLDFSFNPKKVRDTSGESINFKLVIAGKPVYTIGYNI